MLCQQLLVSPLVISLQLIIPSANLVIPSAARDLLDITPCHIQEIPRGARDDWHDNMGTEKQQPLLNASRRFSFFAALAPKTFHNYYLHLIAQIFLHGHI